MNTQKIYMIAAIIIVVLIGLFVIAKPKIQVDSPTESTAEKKLIPVNSFQHAHGLAVDVADPNKLFIATHHGIYALVNDKDLYQVGTSEHDYMGFSPDATNPNIMYGSGHPVTGGNIGVQMSDDGGFTWKKIADGVGGPVDFHAMAVSPINPQLMFGWYQGNIQRSEDGGKTWAIVGNPKFVIISLTADRADENTVYAASPQGAFVSKDKGQTWQPLSNDLKNFVSIIAIDPSNPQHFLSYSESLGLAKSMNNGSTWEKIPADFAGGTLLYIAFSKQNPSVVYALNEKNTLFKSTDGGMTWQKIR